MRVQVLPVIGWQTCPGCGTDVCSFQEHFPEELPGEEAFSTITPCPECEGTGTLGFSQSGPVPWEEIGHEEVCFDCGGYGFQVFGPDDADDWDAEVDDP